MNKPAASSASGYNSSTVEDDDPQEVEFVSNPPQSLHCPICKKVMFNSTTSRICFHNFCRSCIYEAIEKEGVCPLPSCRKRHTIDDIHPNLIVPAILDELIIYCRYRKYGCRATFPFAERFKHFEQCTFKPGRCVHQQVGCKWTGAKVELEDHLKQCPYEALKGFISHVEVELESLRKTVKRQDEELKRLKRAAQQHTRMLLTPPEPAFTSNQWNSLKSLESSTSTGAVSVDLKTPPRVFDVASLHVFQDIKAHNSGVSAVAANEKGLVFCGTHSGVVKCFDPNDNANCIAAVDAHDRPVWALVFTRRGTLVSGSSNGHLKEWRVPEVIEVQEVVAHDRCYALASLPPISVTLPKRQDLPDDTIETEGDLIASGGGDAVIRIWNSADGWKLVSELKGHTEGIWALLATNDLLISSSADATVRIWRHQFTASTHSFQCIHTIRDGVNTTYSLAIANHILFCGTDNCTIEVYDLDHVTNGKLKTLVGHQWEVWALATSSDLLFSGSFDHEIRIWDLTTMECVRVLQNAHNNYIHCLYVNGDTLISASSDRTIKLWKSKS